MECCRDVSCLLISVDREESTLEGRTKESPWCSEIIVFKIVVLQIGCSKPLFSEIFEGLHLMQLGLTAGWLVSCSADEM